MPAHEKRPGEDPGGGQEGFATDAAEPTTGADQVPRSDAALEPAGGGLAAGGTARLFIAVVPPDEVRAQIAGLSRPEQAGVRYTRPDRWHCTLRFLGTTQVEPVLTALAGLQAGAVDVTLGPHASRLGRDVVVLPAAGLDGLAAAVAAVTDHLGEPPDPRPFTGHLTLARLRHRAACGIAGEPFAARFVATEVVLFASQLTPGGARHHVVATQSLGSALP